LQLLQLAPSSRAEEWAHGLPEAIYELVRQYLSSPRLNSNPIEFEIGIAGVVATMEADIRDLKYDRGRWVQVRLRDITAAKAHEQALKQEAATDFLSGLANRRQFRSLLDCHAGEEIALAVIDADHFKSINDRFGHLQGDRAIRFLAGKLSEFFGSEICVARLGGEEFAVVLRAHDRQLVVELLESFRKSVADSPFGEADLTMTVSIGVAFSSDILGLQSDLHELLARADQALYAAKRKGRNQLCEFVPQ
jgi:diguanylate cyclase (GGDEF)-like protein